MIHSRRKGARGEREAAAAWSTIMGVQARRGQQFAGGTESPDVVSDLKDIHLEVKRVESGNPYWWVEQAERDCGGKIPVVLHKRNRKDWLLICRLSDAKRFAKAVIAETQEVGAGPVPPDVSDPGVPPGRESHGEQAGVLPVQ